MVGRRRRCLNAVLARAHAFLSGTGPSLGFEVWGFAFLEFQGNSGCLTFLECFNHKLTGTAPMVPCTCVVDVPCLSKDLLSFSVTDLWLATDTCLVHHLLGCQKATNTHHRTKLCQIQHSYNYRINSYTNWISRHSKQAQDQCPTCNAPITVSIADYNKPGKCECCQTKIVGESLKHNTDLCNTTSQ